MNKNEIIINPELIKKIQDWGHERNLVEGSSLLAQLSKTQEEMAEITEAIAAFQFKSKEEALDMLFDAIGDVGVTLILARLHIDIARDDICFGGGDCALEESIHDENVQLVQLFGGLFESANVYVTEEDKFNGELFDSECYAMFLSLDCLARHHGSTLEECLELAYEQIKDRKGYMENGKFVKLNS